ncbi:cytoplasmic incompatibility factor CifB [Wolbachia endosymbiont (group A) of Epirrhoe alternata]|uniref:cytoplasmic incompatibility factor CifB n=1 Tax=Wolbachia endosymbiont (group A) of Epirrhoe alternata TaxID=2954007 RepID=UPI002230CB56|nr:cytoplasmic incompatibility factor CifB [Wolbachia endosymbiont (group A) of Epirrhoe alternata]
MSLIRSLVDGNLEAFRQEFESFLDRCSSFSHHVGSGRFLPVFFFSMFATAHDANILKANERVYFRFDNHGIDTGGRNRNTGNLKVAVLTRSRDGQRVVKCYSISDHPNSDGLRFSTRERNALIQKIIQQNPDLREGDLDFEQYKVCMHGKGKSQGEAIAKVFEVIRKKDFRGRDKFAKYSASEISLLRQLLGDHRLTIQEIKGRQLNQNQLRQLDRSVNFAQVAQDQQRIDNFMEILANNQRQNVERRMHREVLPYITDIYDNCRQALENNIENRNQKFESHGFLLGFLVNFSHRYTIGIDLDLSPRNSHVAFLIHHQAERENIPIVINLAIFDTPSDVALNCAIGYAERLCNSSSTPTSKHTVCVCVCVGLNFNVNLDPFSVDTVELQQDKFPLVQRLFDCVENEGIRENVRDFLLEHLPAEIPRNAENYNRIFDCIIGFASGSSAFDRHHLQLEGGGEAPVTKYTFRHGDEGLRCLTMVFHAEGSDIVILHIRAHDARQQGAINLQDLNMNGNNVHVWEVSYTLNNQLYFNIHTGNLGLYHNYQNNNANNFIGGNLVKVPNAGNVYNALDQFSNDGWKDKDQYQELLRNISAVLMPENMNGNAIIDVDSEDKFRSILYGVFYNCDDICKVVSRYKISQICISDIRMVGKIAERVNTRVAEHRLDLLVLRQSTENDSDVHLIGFILGFANDQRVVAQQKSNAKQKMRKFTNEVKRLEPLSIRKSVILSYAVFNRGAQGAEDLIFSHRNSSRASGPGGRTERIVRLEDDILPLVNLHIQDNIMDLNSIENVHDILTLDFATDNRYYHYWLQERDIRSAARTTLYNLQPVLHNNVLFATLPIGWVNDHLQKLQNHISNKEMQNNEILISNLIVNIDGSHWATLTIAFQNRKYYGYYASSTGGNVPDKLNNLIVNGASVPVHNVLADQQDNALVQQRDGHNCGIWALENARDISQALQRNGDLGEQGRGVLDEMRDLLTLNVPGLDNIVDPDNLRNGQYFQERRRAISREFQNIDNIHQFPEEEDLPNRRVVISCQRLNEIRQLLLSFLERQYPTHGVWHQQPQGGKGPPMSLSVSDIGNFGNPQSTLEDPKASNISDLSKGKSGRQR